MDSNTIPYGIEAYPPWIPWTSPHGFHGTSPYGFHGTIPYGFRRDSTEQGSISVGTPLSKIMSPFRIEHSTLQANHMGMSQRILLLHHGAVEK
jgi:hypothetical protein